MTFVAATDTRPTKLLHQHFETSAFERQFIKQKGGAHVCMREQRDFSIRHLAA